MRDITPEEKDQLAKLDAKLRRMAPQFRLEEGCKYMRWAVLDHQLTELQPSFIEPMARTLGADGYFNGTVLGKRQLIFFFMPWF